MNLSVESIEALYELIKTLPDGPEKRNALICLKHDLNKVGDFDPDDMVGG